VTGLSCCAANVASRRPTSTEPVNETFFIIGLCIKFSDIWAGIPNRRFTTPLGTPASIKARTNSMHEAGVSSAGFRTTVQPAARAAANFLAANTTGKFHGTKAATGPIALLIDDWDSSLSRGGK